jgi:cephalosporin hydroxylase
MEQTWLDTWWLGARAVKLPADMWIYQELFWEVKPDVVIETGTMFGGSAYYMATLFDLLDHGRIVSIDIEAQPDRPVHERITYVHGSSVDAAVLAAVMEPVPSGATVMVILDSDHSRDHVLAELDVWAPHVTVGSYLIVEDGNVNGHPVLPKYGPGPTEALDRWLPSHPEFEVDRTREKFMHTFNPGGYLKRVR